MILLEEDGNRARGRDDPSRSENTTPVADTRTRHSPRAVGERAPRRTTPSRTQTRRMSRVTNASAASAQSREFGGPRCPNHEVLCPERHTTQHRFDRTAVRAGHAGKRNKTVADRLRARTPAGAFVPRQVSTDSRTPSSNGTCRTRALTVNGLNGLCSKRKSAPRGLSTAAAALAPSARGLAVQCVSASSAARARRRLGWRPRSSSGRPPPTRRGRGQRRASAPDVRAARRGGRAAAAVAGGGPRTRARASDSNPTARSTTKSVCLRGRVGEERALPDAGLTADREGPAARGAGVLEHFARAAHTPRPAPRAPALRACDRISDLGAAGCAAAGTGLRGRLRRAGRPVPARRSP